MSELIHERRRRQDLLKHMIQQLHAGEAPEAVKPQLIKLLGRIPYDDVVAVEQELIADGMPVAEILRLCDVHHQAMAGALDPGEARDLPEGHPARVMAEENRALAWELEAMGRVAAQLAALPADDAPGELLPELRMHFNSLMDVEKHYLRKEHLLFPFLEQHGITGPPTVMWGKHDETRALLKNAGATLAAAAEGGATAGEVAAALELTLQPALDAVQGMIDKEEQILLPMCLDTLTDKEWFAVAEGSDEIGWCLVVPEARWVPAGVDAPAAGAAADGQKIKLPTGTLAPAQLEAMLNTIPFDVTFVDADDTVRYFSHGKERIFARTKAILGRQVQYCHPPKSVGMVERILDDFRAGREDHARFWITLGGRFLCIEYFAMKDEAGAYLGCLEVSQDLTAKRALEGEQRLLSYVGGEAGHE
ncbi:MAG: DUF438 domain-containing protein [Candidatus Krumholzibacteriia bacterium]